MKRVVELAIKAGRSRQSAQTGFIHEQDLIPLYENLCFALALCRSHISDQILEARSLLEKIFHFEVEGNFPIYLHEYPLCRDALFKVKIQPIFYWLMKDFFSLLGEKLKEKITLLMQKAAPFPVIEDPKDPEDLAHYLMAVQMLSKEEQLPYMEKIYLKWHPALAAYQGIQSHKRAEPAVTLLDLYMGELYGSFSKRSLEDESIHLKGALVHPFLSPVPDHSYPSYILSEEKGLFVAWGSKEHLHTFATWKDFKREGESLLFTLQELLPQDNANEELLFYCNAHPDHQILINGKRATSFQIGDQVEIISKQLKITLQFEGKGVFSGFLSKTNRPYQPKSTLFEANDWKIALRTLRRDPICQVKVRISIMSLCN